MSTSEPREDPHPAAQHLSWRRIGLRWLFRLLRVIVLVIGGFLLVLYSLQGRMIFPGAALQGSPETKVHPRDGAELIELSSASDHRVVTLFGPALTADGRDDPEASSRPALIYFYGNAMCLAYCDAELDRFRRLGVNVLIPDYLGFGASGGSASELGCRETAETCYEYLRTRGFPGRRIVAAGWSLGGAVAIDLASRRETGGLIAFSTFTSTQDMGKAIFPLAPPGWFYAHKFDSLQKIAGVKCPILLGHGQRDSIIPVEMSRRLADAAGGSVTRFVIENADHNDFYELGGKKIKDAMSDFLGKIP